MSRKPEILFLSHRIPYPPDKGDKIRSWRLFRHLSKRFNVHLGCFVDDPRDFAHAERLQSMVETAAFVRLNPKLARLRSLSALTSDEPLSFRYFHAAEMASFVETARQRPLVAEIAFSSAMAPFIERPAANRRRIVDFCDADSEKWRQYAEQSKGPQAWLYRRESRLLRQAETRIANWADASFAVSADEARVFNAREGMSAQVGWWRNGVDAEYFNPALSYETPGDAGDVVFVGAMDYHANVEAVLNFINAVWPQIRAKAPDATFAIVGANPVAGIRALGGADGVCVTGRVADVRPWLSQAKVVIAPLRVGRGVQNKVLEAMAMGKPIIATRAAATGIDDAEGAMLIADTPADIADGVLSLLDDKARRDNLGAAARATVQRGFSWEAGLSRFDAALERLGLYSSSSPSASFRSAAGAN